MNYLSCSAFIVDVTLVCVSCIFWLFCTLHLSPAITFVLHLMIPNEWLSSMWLLISFHSQTEITNLLLLQNSFRAFWPNHVVNGLVLILSEPTFTWSSPRNTNGKHFDRSYIFRLNILSLWYLHQCWLSTLSSGGPMIMWWYGPNNCNRRDLITFVIVDSIPIAVCIQSIIRSVKCPYCQYLCHQIKLHPII